MAISPDGTWLASASYDGTARLWSPDGTQLATLTGHTDSVSSVAISPDSTWLATTSRDRTVRLWSPDGTQLATLTGHTGSVWSVAISPDSTWLATTSHDGVVHLWETATREHVTALKLDSELRDLKWFPSGNALAVGGSSGLYLLDLRTE